MRTGDRGFHGRSLLGTFHLQRYQRRSESPSGDSRCFWPCGCFTAMFSTLWFGDGYNIVQCIFQVLFPILIVYSCIYSVANILVQHCFQMYLTTSFPDTYFTTLLSFGLYSYSRMMFFLLRRCRELSLRTVLRSITLTGILHALTAMLWCDGLTLSTDCDATVW